MVVPAVKQAWLTTGSLSLSLRPIFATTCVFQSPGLMGMSASWPRKAETPMRKRDAVQRGRGREGLRGFIWMLLEWIVTGAREEFSTWVGAEETLLHECSLVR